MDNIRQECLNNLTAHHMVETEFMYNGEKYKIMYKDINFGGELLKHELEGFKQLLTNSKELLFGLRPKNVLWMDKMLFDYLST